MVNSVIETFFADVIGRSFASMHFGAPYKYSRRLVFTDALPETQTGKIQRFRLRQ